jgi:hypothetical protein
MDRKELHSFLGRYFSHYRDGLITIFFDDVKDLLKEEIKNIRGTKIPIRFRTEKVKNLAKDYNASEVVFYNAFLEALLKKFKSKKEIEKRVEDWAKNI